MASSCCWRRHPLKWILDQVIRKDIILVLDTSGSMDGEKIVQARDAARFVIDRLNPGDRFNIVSFSTAVRNFAPGLVPADDAGDYRAFINSLEAMGGTNISGALLEAVGQIDDDRPATIIFLTDGLATEGITRTDLLLDTIRQQTPSHVRIFAFGVGHNVDTFLLDSLTQNHGGTSTYVRPGEPIDEAVSAFYAKVSNPVLANIQLDFDGPAVEQRYPVDLPDLFAGSQLVLTGRYRSGGPVTITLTGEVNGQRQTFVYEDHVLRTQGGDDFIPRLWATRAIGHMLTQIRLHGEDEELVSSIVNLSIRYGIITPYTSYLIEEDDIFSQRGRQGIIENEVLAFAAPREFSGALAFAEAADQASMAQALSIPSLPATTVGEGVSSAQGLNVQDLVRPVGSKTFVMRDGVWIDTAFDTDTFTPEQVGFAGETYFELLAAAPELGPYLALGPQVIVVHQGVAYQIVDGPGQEDVSLPVNPPAEANGQDRPVSRPGETPDLNPTRPGDDPERPFTGLMWLLVLLVPMVLVGAAALARRRAVR
jgi:Ca-activated chloride channel homolog